MSPLLLAGWYLLAGLLHILCAPLLIAASFKQKYRASIPARFFGITNPPLGRVDVWIHACSMGEVKSIAPLVAQAQKRGLSVGITTTTATGYAQAGSYAGVERRYLPFESLLPFWISPAGLLIVIEAEIWPILMAVARWRGARVVLAGGRISDRSWPRYQKARIFYRMALSFCERIFVQGERDVPRFAALGGTHIAVAGNIKALSLPKPTRTLRRFEGLTVTAASTHEGEEEAILAAYDDFAAACGRPCRLVVVPRHPERFERVARLLQRWAAARGETLVRWSEGADPEGFVVLADVMGELVNIYAVSDLVVLGGAFVPVGGHNILEPVALGCRVVTGEHLFNQKSLLGSVEGIVVTPPERLAEAMREAMANPRPHFEGRTAFEPLWEMMDELVH